MSSTEGESHTPVQHRNAGEFSGAELISDDPKQWKSVQSDESTFQHTLINDMYDMHTWKDDLALMQRGMTDVFVLDFFTGF